MVNLGVRQSSQYLKKRRDVLLCLVAGKVVQLNRNLCLRWGPESIFRPCSCGGDIVLRPNSVRCSPRLEGYSMQDPALPGSVVHGFWLCFPRGLATV